MAALHRITSLLERTHPSLAHAWANRLFFSPRRKYRIALDLPGVQRFWFSFSDRAGARHPVRVYSAGEGPGVLLIHGWEGAATSFENLAHALVKAGFRILSFDGPAHGTSPGSRTNLVELARVALELGQLCGPFQLVVGHSFGGVVGAYAMEQGLQTNGFATVAAPASTDFILGQFQTIIGASDDTKRFIGQRIQEIAKRSTEHISLRHLMGQLDPLGLVIHDRADRRIPFSEAQDLAQAWPSAQLIATDGLGHSRILRDPDVANHLVHFARSLSSRSMIA